MAETAPDLVRQMPSETRRGRSFLGIVLRFVVREAGEFAGTWVRILRHPFAFFDVRDPADGETVYKGLAFFFYSFVAQQVLWFFSMLPPLPGAESLSPGWRSLTTFLSVISSAVVWHLLLRAVTRRAVPLRGTLAVSLYHSAFFVVLIIPAFVVARIVGMAGRRHGGDAVLLFLVALMPFLAFALAVLCRWMASYHRVRWITAFWTFVVAQVVWDALQKYVVRPFVLDPLFSLLFALYKRLVLLMLRFVG